MPLLPPEVIGSTPIFTAPGNQIGPPLPATSWVWPVKNRYQTVDFLDKNYHDGVYGADVKGFWHTGIDLNVRGTTGNGDAGLPVKAIANGRVEYVAFRNAGGTWGPMVVISHTLPNGKVKYSRYAHLQNVSVKVGQFVTRNQQIAQIGLPSAWGVKFLAHLHFDILHTRTPIWTWWPKRDTPTTPVSKATVTAYFEDAAAFLRSVGAGEPT